MMKILLVEDEKTIRNALRFALQKVGHQICESENPMTALTQIRQQKFDLMILDLNMPHLTGQEFLELLQKEDKLLPTIILTSENTTCKQISRNGAGGEHLLQIISKDLSLPEILKQIKIFLKSTHSI